MEIHDVAVLLDEKAAPRNAETRPLKKRKLRANELILFARTMGELLEGGVPILKALQGLERAASDREFKSLLAGVEENIRRGVEFSEALERSAAIPAFFYQTVYGGEVSGKVPMVLGELAKYMEKEQALKRSIRDALVYPVFILGVGFITLGVLIGFVLPKLRAIYEGFGTKLPFITTLILGLSRAFLPLCFIFSIAGIFLWLNLKKSGRIISIFYKASFIGDFMRGFMRVRFSRLLSLLLESGVPVLEALQVVERTFSDSFLGKDIGLLKESLASGNGFSNCLEKVGWMDSLSRMLVVSGEETGRLSESFFQVARDTESELEARIQLAVKLLEPGLILVIGMAVGFVVIGTVLPIFDMSSIIR
jgi:type II secretory pathway component PulF